MWNTKKSIITGRNLFLVFFLLVRMLRWCVCWGTCSWWIKLTLYRLWPAAWGGTGCPCMVGRSSLGIRAPALWSESPGVILIEGTVSIHLHQGEVRVGKWAELRAALFPRSLAGGRSQRIKDLLLWRCVGQRSLTFSGSIGNFKKCSMP